MFALDYNYYYFRFLKLQQSEKNSRGVDSGIKANSVCETPEINHHNPLSCPDAVHPRDLPLPLLEPGRVLPPLPPSEADTQAQLLLLLLLGLMLLLLFPGWLRPPVVGSSLSVLRIRTTSQCIRLRAGGSLVRSTSQLQP